MWWPNRIKSQSKIITLDWPAKCAAERTIEGDTYLSGKHDLKCFHYSVKFYKFSSPSASQSSLSFLPPLPGPLYIIPTFVVTSIPEVVNMKFVGVREFKEDVVKYLNEGSEIVVMKRKRPIARLTPVPQNSSEIILLEIGRVLAEAGVSKKEALNALEQARKKVYG